MSNVQENNNPNEGFPLDAEEAILAKWEDAENQPSEDEAEAPQESPEETTDIVEEEEITETDDPDEDAEDPDEEETEDDDTDDDTEDDEAGDEPVELSDDLEIDVVVAGESKKVSLTNLKRLAGQEASLTQKSHAFNDLKFLNEEADTFYNDIKQQQKTAMQDAAKDCVSKLQEELPDWSNKLYDDIRSYAVANGLPQDQVDQYVDPSVIMLINKARLYDEGKKVALVKKKKSAASKTVLRSKRSPDNKSSAKASAEKARQRMVQSGGRDLDDIAAAILGSWEA